MQGLDDELLGADLVGEGRDLRTGRDGLAEQRVDAAILGRDRWRGVVGDVIVGRLLEAHGLVELGLRRLVTVRGADLLDLGVGDRGPRLGEGDRRLSADVDEALILVEMLALVGESASTDCALALARFPCAAIRLARACCDAASKRAGSILAMRYPLLTVELKSAEREAMVPDT